MIEIYTAVWAQKLSILLSLIIGLLRKGWMQMESGGNILICQLKYFNM